jgi:hypothetical protein
MTETPDRLVVGLAYQAGPDPRIAKGADGGRDFFTPRELELASRTFLRKGGRLIGMFHEDGTEGHAEATASYIYRNAEPWLIDGAVVAKQGDWVLEAVLDETAWQMVQKGQITGWSPQGSAIRRRSTT